jgi:competence/damage-inducible protein CinA-like protein
MKAGILAVGSELLGTDRVDTNSLTLTESLERHGVELVEKQVVGDDVGRIAGAVSALARAADLVLVTGGLGPTADDVTRDAVARATGRALREDPAIVADIRRKFESFGRAMPEVNRRQAMVLDGAEVIANRRGTAPGLLLEHGDTTLFLFPGVPGELAGMVEGRLEPWLAERSGRAAEHRLTLRVACLPESEVEELLAPVYAEFGEIGVLASPGDVRVRLRNSDPARLAAAEAAVRRCLGNAVYARDGVELEGVVGEGLRRRGLTLATAESCTGGWIAQRLTAVPGSSEYFVGSIIAYGNRVKVEQLGVDSELLERHGAVSPEVAVAMAEGAAARLGSDWAIAVTGVAGPTGGTPAKPVGTVDMALARRDRTAAHRRLSLPGDRATVRLLTTQWALDMVRRALEAEAA